MKVSKPDPKIYQKVKSQLKVSSDELLFFDDSAANIREAKECGWNGELITPLEEPSLQIRKHLKNYDIL